MINNVAVGAAYARAVGGAKHGAARGGIEAIIDFDVHHGNGTEDVIRNLVPTQEEHVLQVCPCTASFKTDKYRPWLNEEDADNVFVSTHGFGRKATEGSSTAPQPWFYPGSGPSCDCGNVRPRAARRRRILFLLCRQAARWLCARWRRLQRCGRSGRGLRRPKVMNIGLGLLGEGCSAGTSPPTGATLTAAPSYLASPSSTRT